MKTFTALFPFCGLGAGALGFLDAVARLGRDGEARFVNLGGIDLDPLACADFEYLTGGRALQADISKLSPAELLAFAGPRRPDCVFLSPPCKGYSRLLSTATSQTAKYQALNELVVQGLFLVVEAWGSPPPAIILENVPGIMSRGAHLLAKARQLLAQYGYVFHEGTHDCGEIGGLGQHRRRFLMVARRPQDIPSFIYRPPLQRVKGCGEVLEQLPLPEDPAAGELHRLPRLSWLNWVRLSLIPAGGDWRDLPAAIPAASLEQTAAGADTFKGRPGLMRVNDWKDPTPAITGSASVSGSNGTAAVADPRLGPPVAPGQARREVFAKYDVRPWTEPARTVAGSGTNGGFAVADPRIARHNGDRTRGGALGVLDWKQPSATVTGKASVTGSNTPASVADPRVPPFGHCDKVTRWADPVHCITASPAPSSGRAAVADPRLALDHEPRRGSYGVTAWTEPASTVRGVAKAQNGGAAVADPRFKCRPRLGMYGVLSWQEAAGTIIGNARIDSGMFAVADPRKPPPELMVIVAEDGTWHRPLTDLELAALQSLPATVNGRPLQLAGRSRQGWRERIGNAVPRWAGRAIAESILKALLAGSLGTWFLSAEGVWVRRDGHHEELQFTGTEG